MRTIALFPNSGSSFGNESAYEGPAWDNSNEDSVANVRLFAFE
jgi:hypothetical protein